MLRAGVPSYAGLGRFPSCGGGGGGGGGCKTSHYSSSYAPLKREKPTIENGCWYLPIMTTARRTAAHFFKMLLTISWSVCSFLGHEWWFSQTSGCQRHSWNWNGQFELKILCSELEQSIWSSNTTFWSQTH